MLNRQLLASDLAALVRDDATDKTAAEPSPKAGPRQRFDLRIEQSGKVGSSRYFPTPTVKASK